MEIDFASIGEYERYKLMASLIVPRPIALITTLGSNGVVNAAPFSMFNMLGEEPPLLMVSINHHKDGTLKDTTRNIQETSEFVVHLSDEAMAEKMHHCGEAFPSDVSELGATGLHAAPSTRVQPPRIVEAPVAFECTLYETLTTASRHIFIGQVQVLHARDGLIDRDKWRVRLQAYFPVGRFGASFYINTRDRFSIDSPGKPEAEHSTAIDEI